MLWTPQDLAIVRDQVLRTIVETGGAGTKVGIVNTVMPDRLRATVTMTDATASSLVKVAGDCWCLPGDKVGLTRFGSEWYVTHVLNRVVGPQHGGIGIPSPGGNTVSVSAVDMPGSPTFPFVKRWNDTPLLLGCWASLYHDTTTAECPLYLAFVDADSVTTTYRVYSHVEGNGALRNLVGGVRRVPDATYTTPLPAGTYTVRLRWSTGSGQVNQNTGDSSTAFAIEGGL
jgi:hypothetical protein